MNILIYVNGKLFSIVFGKQKFLWKTQILLTGVRQCGKTYVCKAFGETYFSDYAYFNFEGNSGLASVFEYDFRDYV